MSRSILLITTSFPGDKPGAEAAGAFVKDVALELSKSSLVRVVAPGTHESRGTSPEGLEIFRFDAGDRPLSLLSPLRPWHWSRILRTLMSLRRQTLAANDDGQVERALAFWVLPSGWAASVLKKRDGVPYAIWALGSDIWSLGRFPMVRSLLASVARGATDAFADGLVLASEAEKVCGRPFQFLPSARVLDVPREAPVRESGPFRFLFLGRWHPNKGVDLLIEALHLLSDDDWRDIEEVHIAGGGPLEREVLSAVEALVLKGRPVRLSGFLGSLEATRALGAADRLLLPSRVESIPVVFSDAMAAGLPVVSMPVGDLPRLIGPGVGWLARQVDAAAFVIAIRESLAQSHRPDLIAACRERFTPSAAAATLAGALGEG